MKLVFYSLFLNHHQARVADEFYKILGDDYRFVELSKVFNTKGCLEDFSQRPYLIKAWYSKTEYDKAMSLAKSAEVCVFAGNECLPFEVERLKLNKLSFDMGERMLKRGWVNLLSPRLIHKMFLHYVLLWNKKPLYKLCCSAFSKDDLYKLHSYKDKCYKWGYFTKLETSGCENFVEASTDVSTSEITPLMWCSRFLMWKHPELPILMAERLKKKGYKFHLDMYGSGECEEASKSLAESLEIMNVVKFHGAVPNDQVYEAMRKAEVFLFTSDKNEGWGAVANESLSSSCVLVGSDAIGSVPYLIKDGFNGLKFQSSKPSNTFGNPDKDALNSLCEKVEWLLNHPVERKQMQSNAYKYMKDNWSPERAAKSLLQLIDDLQNGRESSISEGPGSKA